MRGSAARIGSLAGGALDAAPRRRTRAGDMLAGCAAFVGDPEPLPVGRVESPAGEHHLAHSIGSEQPCNPDLHADRGR
jgi:hypothetical protein